MKAICWVQFVIVMCLVAAAAPTSAEELRFAVVIGANLGEPDEEKLHYAERDASRFAEVLAQVGQVPVENLVVLLGEDATTVERVLSDINTRIASYEAGHPSAETLLMVFYSGHADVAGLHLMGSLLPFKRIKKHLSDSAANLKVLIIDACRSGMITRVKGGKPSKDSFKIKIVNNLDGEGMAIITSSAANEDAQESERLGGSFFTHHLVSGLLGAADKSGDRRVTLGEAYNYAYNETIRSTSRARFVQHPTYAFQIKGRHDLILTDLEKQGRSMGNLLLSDGGSYMLFKGSEQGPLIAEFKVKANSEVAVQAGHYMIRRRVAGAVYEGTYNISAGALVSVQSAQMRRIPYGHIVRKGLAEQHAAAWGVSVGAGLTGPIAPNTGVMPIGMVGGQLDLEILTLQMRFRYGQSHHTNAFVENNQQLMGGELSLLKLFDWDEASFGFGFRVGTDRLTQRFDTSGDAPERTSWTGGGGLVFHLAYTPLPWFSLYAEGNGDVQAVNLEDSDRPGKSRFQAEFVPHASAGFVFYMF